jgi:hypothetical protein
MLSVLVSAGTALGVSAPAWAGDLALGRPASASSTERDLALFAPGRANDGDSATRWSSGYVDGQWWEVDLGSDRTFGRVELDWEVAYASRYAIRTRSSGSGVWSTAAEVAIDSPGLRVHTFAPRSARYVQVRGDARGTPWGISLWDARVCDNDSCGAPAPPPVPTPTPTPDWTFCSNEFERCSFLGTKQVRYGANATWTTAREFTDGVDCSNQVFGDPLWYVTKRCEIRDTPTPTPSPDPVPEPSPGAPTLMPVDGGSGYYGTHNLPASQDFFPIGAWFRPADSATRIATEKEFGMNTWLGVECPECANEQALRDAGAHAFIQHSERSRFNDLGSERKGWTLSDEVDMCCGPPGFAGGNGYTMLTNESASLADVTPRYVNYGKGVLLWETDADAARFVNLPFVGYVTADLYYMTDPNERGTARYGLPSSYGWVIDRMRALDNTDGQRKPIWAFVETGWPFTESATAGGRRILPAEARAAVWHSLIAGARGVAYFDHNFGPATPGSTILGNGYADTRAVLKDVNAQIKQLATVLNSPSVTSATTTSSGIRALYKWNGQNFYVFAANRDNTNKTGTMGLPCLGDATAHKLGEDNETIPVVQGTFTDEFADKNAAHIYRIDGGSRCGL